MINSIYDHQQNQTYFPQKVMVTCPECGQQFEIPNNSLWMTPIHFGISLNFGWLDNCKGSLLFPISVSITSLSVKDKTDAN